MDVHMDPMENISVTNDNNSEEQESQSDETVLGVRQTASQVTKSWGFRRTTIARREFMEEVRDLTQCPPLVRRGRSRRPNQTPQTSIDNRDTERATCAPRTNINDLEWSAPSSPVAEEPAAETSAIGSLDPSMWQDFGSAFHTAFSLLGGNEAMSLEMPDALAAPDILEATDAIEETSQQAADEYEVPDDIGCPDDTEISQPVAPENVGNEDIDDVVLISSQEEDSDEMTLIKIKEQLASKGRQGNTRARGGKGGRGKAKGRGRGRGRGKGKGRGRGRGRAVEVESIMADDEDDDVMFVNSAEPPLQQLQEEQNENDSHSPSEIEVSPMHSISLSPAQPLSSDCIIIDTDLDQITDATSGQYDDATEEEDGKKDDNPEKIVAEYSSISDTEGYDSNALYCICRQKHNKRFMICCDSCQEWFHGDCVGISETQGRKMEKKGQEYICPPCAIRKQNQLQSESHTLPDPELSAPECMILSPSVEEGEGHEEQQSLKQTVELQEEVEVAEEVPVKTPEPHVKMETDSSFPLCIGPECSKQALPDSVYCGTDCILQHAAFTMKTISGPKVAKSRGRVQRTATRTSPATKVQKSARMSKRLAGKTVEEVEEEEMKEEDGRQEKAASSLACDPVLTEVQATSLPSSKFYTASNKDCQQVEADSDAATPSKQCPDDPSSDAAPSSQAVTEPARPLSQPHVNAKEAVSSDVTEQKPSESDPPITPSSAKSGPCPATQSPTTSAPKHHETGALLITNTTYVIPKKPCGPQPSSSQVSASVSGLQKPSLAPAPLNETRNLPVPPAPSAPSARPSQPNNQVRQSIQRSLTSILFKRVCECEDLQMSESEVVKLVASIEMEMFDIFRNTDSKYMNKYRTIMFNLKDAKNKGLLYRVVRGDITPFRLVRMSQKDMQATKAPEPSAKEPSEIKDAAAKPTSLLQKPEAVKVDLPCLNPTRPDRRPESTKRSLPTPALKTRESKQSQGSAIPDILTCMLKDTTSEHKAHLFDLKCKICTGQIIPGQEEEPAKKKTKVSESRDKHFSRWRKSAGDDSPLRAPPDSPDMDSPTYSLMDSSSCLTIDSPALTIVESPASPTMDSPASPILESPASPVMESPTSPTPDLQKAPKKAYTPVVIPAVSIVTITRRDPRTAASRISATSIGTSGPMNTTHNQSAPYPPTKEGSSPSAPALKLRPSQTLPKSILMKPSSSSDPRHYGTSSRTVISESPADGGTAQFLAKQDILWKGFLNMITVAKFVTKGYLVSGSAEALKADLPDTIQIGGRIMPQTVWDYVAKLKSSVTKELCVIRFHPATEEEEVAYVSLFSYFSSRGRFGVVASGSRSIKDVYLVPLSANESIPSILQPLEGPGLEKNRPNLLLGLAIIQKPKRPGSMPQEIEDKRPKVHMPKDPMWIPKPPVLYGSDKLEIFQPYDPATPTSKTPPGSPPCPGTESDSSSGSVTIPSLSTSIKPTHLLSTSATVDATQSTSISISDEKPKASSDKTPLCNLLKTLFKNKQTNAVVSSGGSFTKTVSATMLPASSQGSESMVDPIVQQYGQRSKVKVIEEEENALDRPYDPEEEYNPAIGYGMVLSQNIEKVKVDDPPSLGCVDDDVAYDPEDETIFQDIQTDAAKKQLVPTQMSDSPSCLVPISNQVATPGPTSTPAQTSILPEIQQSLPTGTVVVSAATLTEQQRMLEELNKQIEEQKRQLKEQEEALRQQREAVGMFMARFSVSDSLMSPPSKSLPLSPPSSQSGIIQTETKPSETTDKASNLTEPVDSPKVDSQTIKSGDTDDIPHVNSNTDTVTEQDEASVKESDKYSSAGEIEDSDVPYDPEEELLFNEIQEDVFQGGTTKTQDSSFSRAGHSGIPSSSYHSRKHRLSPKRRSHRERDRHRSPSRRSQRRSSSHSRKRKERHRKSERDRSKHRPRDQSERQARHQKEHTTRRHSYGRRRSPSSPRKNDFVALSPHFFDPQNPMRLNSPLVPVAGQFARSSTPSYTPVTIKSEPDDHQFKYNLVKITIPQQKNSDNNLSREHPQNVKLEISEQSKSQELYQAPGPFQVVKVNDQDNSGSCPSAVIDKLPQLETLLQNKLESPIPLREIDPPTRDSPQSPDPEPQFMKPSSIEKTDSVKIEEISDSVTQTSGTTSIVKVENDCPPIGCQETQSSISWPTNKSTKSKASDIQGPDVGYHGMTESQKQREGEYTGPKQPEILGQGGGCLNPGPEIDNGLKRSGPGMTGPGNKSQGPDCKNPVKEPRQSCPQIDFTRTGVSHPEPDMSGDGGGVRDATPDMKSACPSFSGSGRVQMKSSHDGRPALESNESTGPEGRYLRASPVMTDEKRVSQRGHYTPMRGTGPNIHSEGDVSESHARISSRDMGETFPNRRDAGIQRRSIQGQRPEKTNDNMGQEEGGPIPDIRNPDRRDPGPGFVVPGMLVHRRQNREFDAHTSDPDWSDPGSVIRDDRRGPKSGECGPVIGQFKQDEWRVHQTGPRGPTMENLGPDRRGAGGLNIRGPNMEGLRHDREGPGGPHFMGQGLERRGLDMRDSRHDRRGQSGPGFMGPGATSCGPGMVLPLNDRTGPGVSDVIGPRPERIGPFMEVPVHDRKETAGLDFRGQETREIRGPAMEGPVPDSVHVRSDFRGPGLQNSVPGMDGQVHGRRGPGGPDHFGPGFERVEQAMGLPGPDRRGLGGPNFRGPGPQRKDPAIEGQEPDMRGPTGPDFREPWPKRRCPDMVSPGPDKRGPRGPAFSGPGLERRGPQMEGPGHDSRGFGHTDFRGPGAEGKGLSTGGSGPDRRGPGVPDFRRTGPDKRGPGGPDFWEPGFERQGLGMDGHVPDRRGRGRPNLRGFGCERRGVPMEGQGPNRIGLGDQNTGELGPDRTEPFKVFSDLTGPGSEKNGLVMEGPGPRRKEQEGRHMPETGHPNMEDSGPDRISSETRGAMPERLGSCMEGPGLNRSGPRGPNMKRPRLHSDPNIEGTGPDMQIPEVTNFMGPGPEGRSSDIERTRYGRGFSGGSQMRGPDPEKIPQDMRGPESHRRGPSFRAPGPERNFMGGLGPDSEGPRHPDFREPIFDSRGNVIESEGPDRRESGGSGFRKTSCERRGQAMEGPGPDWKLQGPDFRGPGSRQKGPEDLRYGRRGGRGGIEWGGSESIQESPDIEGQVHDRKGQNLSGPRLINRDIRGPEPDMSRPYQGDRLEGPDISGSAPDRRGTYMDGQWTDERVHFMEGVENERQFSGDAWNRHGHRDPGRIEERLSEQGQKYGREDYCNELRGPGSRDLGPIQERPNMLFPGPGGGPGDDWAFRDPGPFQDDPDMVCLRPGRGGPDNRWRELGRGAGGRGRAGPRRLGPPPFFGSEGGPDNKGSAYDGRGSGMRDPGSENRGGPDMGNDWGQPGNIRGHTTMEGPGPLRGGPDLINSSNRREYEMEGLDKRGPGEPHFRHPGSVNRNSNIEGPRADVRSSDHGGLGSKRLGVDIESSGPGRQGFEHDLRGQRRGSDRRRLGPDEMDMRGPPGSSGMRHGPGRWDTNTEGLVSDRRGSDMMGSKFDPRGYDPAMKGDMQRSDIRGPEYNNRGLDMRGRRTRQRDQATVNEGRGLAMRRSDISASPHFSGPQSCQQGSRSQGPTDPHAAVFNRPLDPAPNSGGKKQSPQCHQAVKPQRHRAALLPTPKEGLMLPKPFDQKS